MNRERSVKYCEDLQLQISYLDFPILILENSNIFQFSSMRIEISMKESV